MNAICPMKFNQMKYLSDGEPIDQDCHCEGEACAWWNERFGMCCQAVDAYLKGQEDWRREREIVTFFRNRRGG